MVIGPTRHNPHAVLGQISRQHLGILHHLLLVHLELRRHGLLEADCLGGNGVHQGAALKPWKDLLVQFLCILGLAEHHAATRTAKGFMRGRGNKIGVGNRTGMHAGGNQACNVGHIHHEQGPHAVGDFAKPLEV